MYVWLFENLTPNKFSGQFKFYLENLRNEDDEDEMLRSRWDVYLNPNETCLKKMFQIDPLKNSTYECSYSCELN